MFYQFQKLHFKCNGCGKCCTGNNDNFIGVDDDEQFLIQEFLGITKKWFQQRYVRKVNPTLTSLVIENGACVFLRNNSCRIYPVRPTQCKTYPFWPEIVYHKSTWEKEKKRCEGIGVGDPIPISRIKKCLDLSNASTPSILG